MRRYNERNHARYLTFSTYKGTRLFASDRVRDVFADQLAETQTRHFVLIYAWVLMPNHAHLLVRAPVDGNLTPFLRGLKSGVARTLLRRWRSLDARILPKLLDTNQRHRVWQHGGGYDRNIISDQEFDEKVGYIHMNPVRAGLVERPLDWAWSSARFWNGDRSSPVQCVHRR